MTKKEEKTKVKELGIETSEEFYDRVTDYVAEDFLTTIKDKD